METITNNENLVNNSNQSQQEQKMNKFQKQFLVDIVDKLLIERLPDLVSDELDWIREEFGDEKISEFLCGDEYYSESPLLRKMEFLIMELTMNKN